MKRIDLHTHSIESDGAQTPAEVVRTAHAAGLSAMALSDRSVSVSDPRLKQEKKLAILLGTEGTGLTAETIRACDYTVKIPMFHNVDSLNVAAASAVAFWEMSQPQ